MSINFPFIYEQYILNEQQLIKFINTDTNHYGLCASEYKCDTSKYGAINIVTVLNNLL